MTNNFILAYGGTGGRCLEAFLYISAARLFKEPVRLLIIDPDQSNGNLLLVRQQLQRYKSIQQSIQNTGDHPEPCFSTEINPGLDQSSFLWQFPASAQEFKQQINFASHLQEEQNLLEILFDEDDMNMTFEAGYVGRAHLGSFDLLRTESEALGLGADGQINDDPTPNALQLFFKEVTKAVQTNTQVNLMVLGSIFGGTGASGIPATPALLKRFFSRNPGLRNQMRLASVFVAPYFTFPRGHEKAPDSTLHPLATQAALFHYANTEVGYDEIYLLGAPNPFETNSSNALGGLEQKNKAHYIELAAGLAVAHFLGENITPNELLSVKATGGQVVNWRTLPYDGESTTKDYLLKFSILAVMHAKYMADYLKKNNHKDARWMKDLVSRQNGSQGRNLGGHEKPIPELNDFLKRYLEWLEEVRNPSSPILFDESLKIENILADTMDKMGGSYSGRGEMYHLIQSFLNAGYKPNQSNGVGWYISALTRAVDMATEKQFKVAF